MKTREIETIEDIEREGERDLVIGERPSGKIKKKN